MFLLISPVLSNKDGRSNFVFSGCLQFLIWQFLCYLSKPPIFVMLCEISLGCVVEIKNNMLRQQWLKVDYGCAKK